MKFIVIAVCLVCTGCTMNFKFPTAGQHPDDAAIISFTLQGNSLKPAAPTGLTATADPSGNWHASMVLHPRESELPARGIMRFRRFSDGILMRDIPMVQDSATSFAAVFSDTAGDGSVVNNNLYGSTVDETDDMLALVAQEITEEGGIVEATAAFDYSVNLVTFSQLTEISLIESDTVPWYGGFAGGSPYSIILDAGNAARTSAGITIFEQPLGGPNILYTGTVLLPAKLRISFVGTQVRFYVDWVNSNSKPLAVGTQQLIFPLKVALKTLGGNQLLNVRVGGLHDPQTIYSSAQQTQDNEDNGGTGLLDDITIEGWQVSPLTPPDFKGIPTPVTRFTY